MIIDATDLLVGRLATQVAKKALLGEKIDVVNCENAVMSGDIKKLIARYKQRIGRTTVAHGPFFPRMADRFVRRTIRGMLPYKQEKGEKAFKRIMCYIGVPESLEGKTLDTINDANVKNRQVRKFVKVSRICKEIGAKNE